MKRQLFACLAVLGFTAAALAGPTGVWIVNGQNVYRSTDGGSSFSNTGTVSAATNIVALGYHYGSGTFYASGQDGNLYSVNGLDTAAPTLNFVVTLGTGSISFDFVGDTFYGVRGNDLISIADINAPVVSVVNSNTGYNNVPATGLLNGSNYYGMTGNGEVIELDLGGGASTSIGNTGLGNLSIAGGSEAGGQFHAAVGRAADNLIRYGRINTTTGAWTEIGNFNPGDFGNFRPGTMGMTVVIPLPGGAGLALAGLGMVAIRRRR